jgi:D-arabinose 1-dehydrogenase-like Zn-dependent alcohol dehydrogenase
MKAMVLAEFGKPLKLEERSVPQIGPDEALVKVKACGVGLTLKHIRHGGSIWIKLPRIIGHEVGGVVEKVGSRVTNCRPGDRVAVYLYLTCGDCEFCVSGRESLCVVRGGSVGTAIDGGFAEYMKVPARNLVQIPEGVGFAEAGIAADAIATPWHVASERARIKPNDVVLVIGAAGGLGIHMVQVAKAFGAQVIGADVSDERLGKVKEYGADEIINVRSKDPIEEAKRLTKGRGVDCSVDTVGTAETMRAGIGSLARGGTVVLLGHHPDNADATVEFSLGQLRHGRIFTSVTYATRQHVREAMELVRRGLVRPVIQRKFRLEEVNEALDLVDQVKLIGRAAVVFD